MVEVLAREACCDQERHLFEQLDLEEAADAIRELRDAWVSLLHELGDVSHGEGGGKFVWPIPLSEGLSRERLMSGRFYAQSCQSVRSCEFDCERLDVEEVFTKCGG